MIYPTSELFELFTDFDYPTGDSQSDQERLDSTFPPYVGATTNDNPLHEEEVSSSEADDVFLSDDHAFKSDNQGTEAPPVIANISNTLEVSNGGVDYDQGLFVNQPTTSNDLICNYYDGQFCQGNLYNQYYANLNLLAHMYSILQTITNTQFNNNPPPSTTNFIVETPESMQKKARKTTKAKKRKANVVSEDITSSSESDTSGSSSTAPSKKTKLHVHPQPPIVTTPSNIGNQPPTHSGYVYNDIYVNFDKPLDKEVTLSFPLYWSSTAESSITEHSKVEITFHPYDGTYYRINILKRKELISYLKEHKQLPKKPSKTNQFSEGGKYYLQVNTQLYQLYSKYIDPNGTELNNTLIIQNSSTDNLSMQWCKQRNYTHTSFPQPTCQIRPSFSNDAN